NIALLVSDADDIILPDGLVCISHLQGVECLCENGPEQLFEPVLPVVQTRNRFICQGPSLRCYRYMSRKPCCCAPRTLKNFHCLTISVFKPLCESGGSSGPVPNAENMKNARNHPNKTPSTHKTKQTTNHKSPASSSDSDSSDEDVPVARKPAGATTGAGASKPMTPATKGVVSAAGGGKGLSAAVASSKRPAVSSSDSDSNENDVSVSKEPARVVDTSNGVLCGFKSFPLGVGAAGKRSINSSDGTSNAKRHKFDVSDMVDVDCGRRSLPAVSNTFNGVDVSGKSGSLSNHKGRQSFPFRRVPDDIEVVDPRLSNNSYEAKPNSRGAWGERAYKDFQFTSGKSFKHEKTKKKRGNYAGGALSTAVSSYKFDD
ncbi:hypothetical protein T265_14746, partial [Opisthorchis viverrini]